MIRWKPKIFIGKGKFHFIRVFSRAINHRAVHLCIACSCDYCCICNVIPIFINNRNSKIVPIIVITEIYNIIFKLYIYFCISFKRINTT
ncbi:hypothetical protein C484_02065 [Natrialba taiwanensis DSM 12281]|uniref:Uncharacterized protein n=1 Tax=Natrialba taiwanensis DSM 12281 TaxID=1230458 RepID=M0AD54_9EURY|nr:hypothetical protein C484_02065 [Natrialba taiwanensis DSM 12281]